MIVEDNHTAMAVLGGTFDPIHHGHLRLAIDLAEQLNLSSLKLMPGYQPMHRDTPSATAEQRLQMLKLAICDNPILDIDERELKRKGPSYTLLSLKEIRTEVGPETPLYFVLGEDAFCHFDKWHQWQQLINYAHILIAVRPGSHPQFSEELADFVNKVKYQGRGYPKAACGSVVFIDNAKLELSSTEIRQKVAKGQSIHYLLPKNVVDYIQLNKIYSIKLCDNPRN
jgi:nicotinate-nucleotide adenylyltransferase